MVDALTQINTRSTSQSEAAKSNQVENNAGGFVFKVTPETRLRRFLILGTDGGTYYQGEAELTKENALEVLAWAEHSTKQLVDLVVEISTAGRAPKQNPAIFALAAAAGLGNDEGRAYALAALSKVARTGTHLFLFAQYVEQFRGWGRGLRKAVGAWYESKDADKLAYQMVKYRQRNGWSHRDLLRLTHPSGSDEAHRSLYYWATQNKTTQKLPDIVFDFLEAQTGDKSVWLDVVNRGRVSWEMLPDAALTDADVWSALLDNGVPQTALMRQLPRLTNLGVLKGSRITQVAQQLADQERLTKARVHPINVLVAQKTYAGGQSLRGTGSWNPVAKIVDALDEAFYKSFGNVEPANKRTMNALDISGSMGAQWGAPNPTGLTAREISAAMSLVTLATEPEVSTYGFSHEFISLPLSSRQRLDDVIRSISGLPFGRTDCALPMVYAKQHSLEVDTFVLWTDNETWAGNIHPFQALKEYRKASGIPAKLVVCATSPTEFSIADSSDAGMLDCVGFDSAVPNLIADFSAGRL